TAFAEGSPALVIPFRLMDPPRPFAVEGLDFLIVRSLPAQRAVPLTRTVVGQWGTEDRMFLLGLLGDDAFHEDVRAEVLVVDTGLDLEIAVTNLLLGDRGDDLGELRLFLVAPDGLRERRADEGPILDREDGQVRGDRDVAEEGDLMARGRIDLLD